MREKTCCFTGHRDISCDEIGFLLKSLMKTIIELTKRGVIYYGCGGAIGFDMLAGLCVLAVRKKYKEIKLIMVLPCKNQDMYWKRYQKVIYRYILKRADKIVYISENYTDRCMLDRNRHLVDNSEYCVCYLRKNSGGTDYTVKYARKKKRNIIEI